MEFVEKKLSLDIKQKWVEALRSGKYNQTIGVLYNGNNKNGFCCLGVLGHVCGVSLEVLLGLGVLHSSMNVPKLLMGDCGSNIIVEKLTRMNDIQGKSFTEIADWIEQNL